MTKYNFTCFGFRDHKAGRPLVKFGKLSFFMHYFGWKGIHDGLNWVNYTAMKSPLKYVVFNANFVHLTMIWIMKKIRTKDRIKIFYDGLKRSYFFHTLSQFWKKLLAKMYSPISEPFWSIVNFVSVIPKSFEFMPNFTAKPWIELRSKELDFAICSHDFSLRRPQLSPAWIVFLRAQFSRTMRVRSFESCVCVPLSTTHNQDFQIDFYTRATCNFLFISSSLMMIRNESDFRAEKFLGLKAYLLSLGSTFKYGTFLISSAGFEGISVLEGCLITYKIFPLASLHFFKTKVFW